MTVAIDTSGSSVGAAPTAMSPPGTHAEPSRTKAWAPQRSAGSPAPTSMTSPDAAMLGDSANPRSTASGARSSPRRSQVPPLGR